MDKKFCKGLIFVFDILFIMVLCFATLLAVMLLQGKIVVDYRINFVTLAIVGIVAIAFIVFIIIQSTKELRNIIERHDWNDEKKHMDGEDI